MSESAITYEFSRCMKCFRSAKTCYCKYIEPFDSGVKFVFLMHPKEAFKQRTGTGRLAHLTLENSEILIGVDFTENKRLNALLNDKSYVPLLLYPGEDAWSAQTESEGQALKEMLGDKTLLVIVVDATWFFAKKILRLSKNIQHLQKISFRAGYKSQFQFKTQPEEECLSTIESCYYLINELKGAGICKDVSAEPLMNIFKRMVAFQLESQKERERSGEPDRYKLAGSMRAGRAAARKAKAEAEAAAKAAEIEQKI
ncbi:MAG: DTW domain-containing protein [Spirochaetaceae bacterium]|nr:DTW domain-containing protein [Spirochaetaceae bacterium]